MDSQAPAERILMFVWCVFCSSSSYRIIFLADEIESDCVLKSNCTVVPTVPNCYLPTNKTQIAKTQIATKEAVLYRARLLSFYQILLSQASFSLATKF